MIPIGGNQSRAVDEDGYLLDVAGPGSAIPRPLIAFLQVLKGQGSSPGGMIAGKPGPDGGTTCPLILSHYILGSVQLVLRCIPSICMSARLAPGISVLGPSINASGPAIASSAFRSVMIMRMPSTATPSD